MGLLFSHIYLSPQSQSSSSHSQSVEDSDDIKRIRERQHRIKQLKNQEVKLVLLGTGNAGKTTLFKQISILTSGELSQQIRENHRNVIRENVVLSIKALMDAVNQWKLGDYKEENQEAVKIISDFQVDLNLSDKYTSKIGAYIGQLWKDPIIQKAYERKNEISSLMENAKYFLDAVERISDNQYIPNQQDVIMCRLKSVGITDIQFTIGPLKLRLLDVGGMRPERKKWPHVLDGVSMVLFVINLADYDQKCQEDNKTNRMKESLKVFEEICSNENIPVILLFFNKEDIFLEKIKKVDLKCCFEDYTGGLNSENAKNFIVQKFLALNKFNKKIEMHFINASDTELLKTIFEKVSDQCKQVVNDQLKS